MEQDQQVSLPTLQDEDYDTDGSQISDDPYNKKDKTTGLRSTDPNFHAPSNEMFIGRKNTETEQREVDYLDHKVNPVLCQIMPMILQTRSVNPVPLMIRKLHQMQEQRYIDKKNRVNKRIEKELDWLEQKTMAQDGQDPLEVEVGNLIRTEAELNEYQMLMEQRDRLQQEVDQLMAENLVQNDMDNLSFPTPNAVHIKENDLEEVPSVVDNSRNVTDHSKQIEINNTGQSQITKQGSMRYNTSANVQEKSKTSNASHSLRKADSKSQVTIRDKSQQSQQKSGRSNNKALHKRPSFLGSSPSKSAKKQIEAMK